MGFDLSRCGQVVEETLEMLDALRLQQERNHRKWIDEANRRLKQRSAYRIQRWFQRRRSSIELDRQSSAEQQQEQEENVDPIPSRRESLENDGRSRGESRGERRSRGESRGDKDNGRRSRGASAACKQEGDNGPEAKPSRRRQLPALVVDEEPISDTALFALISPPAAAARRYDEEALFNIIASPKANTTKALSPKAAAYGEDLYNIVFTPKARTRGPSPVPSWAQGESKGTRGDVDLVG
jgi:hypothetical protein